MLVDQLEVDADMFRDGTGWDLKPEGACRGEVCVPLPPSTWAPSGKAKVDVVAGRLGMPLVRDDAHDVWALGPAAGVNGKALPSAVAPELVLPDLDGREFCLSSLRGRKVVLVAWASW